MDVVESYSLDINTRHKFLRQKQQHKDSGGRHKFTSRLQQPWHSCGRWTPGVRHQLIWWQQLYSTLKTVTFTFWLRDPHYGCSIHNACWSTSLQQHDHKWSWWNKTGVWWNSAPQKMLEILFGIQQMLDKLLHPLTTAENKGYFLFSNWFWVISDANICTYVFYLLSQRTLSLSCSGIQLLCPLSSWCRHTVLSKMYSLGTIGKQISECFASCVHKRHHISRYWCFILKPLLADTDDVPILSCIKYIWYKKGELTAAERTGT